MEGREMVAPPPFEAWATVSISDSGSDSQDDLEFTFTSLQDEVKSHEQEVESKLQIPPDFSLPKLVQSPSSISRSLEEECATVLESLKRHIPGMEEDTNLLEEFRALRNQSPQHR